MRVVFDTNIYVSYLLGHRPPISELIDVHLERGDFTVLTALPLLLELARVLEYPHLRRYFTEEEKTRFLSLVRVVGEIVDLPEEIPRICRDPDDDWVIACAVIGGADLIISGDKDLLVLEQIGGINILSPAQFLKMLLTDG